MSTQQCQSKPFTPNDDKMHLQIGLWEQQRAGRPTRTRTGTLHCGDNMQLHATGFTAAKRTHPHTSTPQVWEVLCALPRSRPGHGDQTLSSSAASPLADVELRQAGQRKCQGRFCLAWSAAHRAIHLRTCLEVRTSSTPGRLSPCETTIRGAKLAKNNKRKRSHYAASTKCGVHRNLCQRWSGCCAPGAGRGGRT